MDAENLCFSYKDVNNPHHRSPPTLCRSLFTISIIIGGAVAIAAMPIARTGDDAAIVIATTGNAPTADEFKPL